MSENITLPYTDPTGQTWSFEEIQAVVNQTGSFTKTVARLQLKNTNQLRALGVLSPPQWVKKKATEDAMWLPRLILQTGSIRNAAELLNVSAAHLGTVLNEGGFSTKLPQPDATKARELMQKFGSVIYVARMMETTPNLIKEVLPDWKSYRDPTRVGTTSIRTGRIGELYYEAVRRENVVASPALENHNNPGYDHIDREYGKVNTKAAVAENHKWAWELDMDLDCEAFALVQLSISRDPVGLVMVRKEHIRNGDTPRGMLCAFRENTNIVMVNTKMVFTVREPIDLTPAENSPIRSPGEGE